MISDFAELDEDGYFELFLSQEQLDALQSGKTQLHVSIPQSDGRGVSTRNDLPSPPLARDKAKEKTMRIARIERRSLVGKALPDLKELGLSLALADGRPILLCIVDVDQRPSRQCLTELARKMDMLSAAHIAVVIAQDSAVDLKQHEDWLKAIRMTEPIRVIASDFETRRFRWGIEALPWLILADKGHAVRAEGFAIDELDKVLQEAK